MALPPFLPLALAAMRKAHAPASEEDDPHFQELQKKEAAQREADARATQRAQEREQARVAMEEGEATKAKAWAPPPSVSGSIEQARQDTTPGRAVPGFPLETSPEEGKDVRESVKEGATTTAKLGLDMAKLYGTWVAKQGWKPGLSPFGPPRALEVSVREWARENPGEAFALAAEMGMSLNPAGDVIISGRDLARSAEDDSKLGMFLASIGLIAPGYGTVKGLGRLGKEVTKDIVSKASRKGAAEQVPVFYSHLDEVVGGMKQNVGVNDVEKFFLGKGVKKGELRDLDIEGLVSSAKAQGKKSLSQDEIVEHVAKNRRPLEDVRLGQQSPEQLAALQERNEAFKPVRAQLEESGVDPDFIHRVSGRNREYFDQNLNNALEFTEDKLIGLYKLLDGLSDTLKPLENTALKGYTERFRSITRPTTEMISGPRVFDAPEITADKAESVIALYKEMLNDPVYRKHLQNAADHRLAQKSPGPSDHPWLEGGAKGGMTDEDRAVEYLDQQMKLVVGRTLPDAGPLAREIRDIRGMAKVKDSPELKAFFDVEERTRPIIKAGEAKAPRFSQWVADGSEHPAGKNYQEMLITSPSRAGKIIDDPDVKELQETIRRHQMGVRGGLRGSDLNEKATFAKIHDLQDKVVAKYPDLDPIPKNPRLKSISFPNEKGGALHLWDTAIEDLKKSAFTESHHSDIPDVMLHIRTTDRIDDQGRRVLFVDEIQSDWHQQGRQAGYKQSPEEVSRLNDEYKELVGKKIEARNKFDRAKENAPGPWASLDGASPEAQEIVRLHDEFDSISDAADEAKRVMNRAYKGLPSTSHQKTEEWLPLAVRRVLRRASDEGLASQVVSMPQGSATVFYDQKLPGVLKREVGIPKKQGTEEFFFDFGDGQETMAGVSLTPELKKKLSGPQKLYSAIPLAVGAGAAAGAAQDEDKSLEDKRMEAIRRAMSE